MYSFQDYEDAFYKCQVHKCIEIGLSLLTDERLIKELSNMNYSCDSSIEELNHITAVLAEVRNNLRINCAKL